MIELMQKQDLATPIGIAHLMMRRNALGGITSQTTMWKAENYFADAELGRVVFSTSQPIAVGA